MGSRQTWTRSCAGWTSRCGSPRTALPAPTSRWWRAASCGCCRGALPACGQCAHRSRSSSLLRRRVHPVLRAATTLSSDRSATLLCKPLVTPRRVDAGWTLRCACRGGWTRSRGARASCTRPCRPRRRGQACAWTRGACTARTRPPCPSSRAWRRCCSRPPALPPCARRSSQTRCGTVVGQYTVRLPQPPPRLRRAGLPGSPSVRRSLCLAWSCARLGGGQNTGGFEASRMCHAG